MNHRIIISLSPSPPLGDLGSRTTSFSTEYKESYLPEEFPKKIKESKRNLIIGVPKEDQTVEKRLALTPEAVAELVKNGYRVILESGAGLGINYGDVYYSEAGAEITENPDDIYKANIVLKISRPTISEIEKTKPQTTIFSMLQVTSCYKKAVDAMLQKKINAVGYELIADNKGKYPFVNSISEIDGICGITLASELLSNSYGGKGILLGGIPGISPVEIVILGAGVAGAVATRAAMSLGATVKVFDHDINRLREIQRHIGPHLFTSNYHENVLRNAFKSADVAIATFHHFNEYNRFRISEDLVRSMKKGAVILDLSIGQGGGSFETSEFDKEKKSAVYEKFGVLHYCIFNISSRVARTASMAISNCLVPLLLQVEDNKYFSNMIKTDVGFKSGIYLYKGHVVNPYIGKFFNLPIKNIELYLGGF